jgi:hypothetical protein
MIGQSISDTNIVEIFIQSHISGKLDAERSADLGQSSLHFITHQSPFDANQHLEPDARHPLFLCVLAIAVRDGRPDLVHQFEGLVD